jgi:hypothetical protein
MSAPVLLLRGTRWEASACFENPVFIDEHIVHDGSLHEHEVFSNLKAVLKLYKITNIQEKTGLRVWDSVCARLPLYFMK